VFPTKPIGIRFGRVADIRIADQVPAPFNFRLDLRVVLVGLIASQPVDLVVDLADLGQEGSLLLEVPAGSSPAYRGTIPIAGGGFPTRLPGW
jgi:hypothetical protein